MRARQILVTAALPYANGPIHLGHLVEYIQADIWVRFQRLRGHRCIYVCADDTHGTAIMLRAREEGCSEEALIARMQRQHVEDFAGFDVLFDHYGSTNSPENRVLCETVWRALRAADLVVQEEVTQLYDASEGVFLADRFVKGTCPYCGLPDQYGDSCENGHTYRPTELQDAVSALSGTKPEIRAAPHLFIELEKLRGFLAEWTQGGTHLQPQVANYLKGNFLAAPLRRWDVSRPAPYFGFEIPDCPGHYWYVWFDAPIGYMAATQQWCDRSGEDFNAWWRRDETELHHFIGKDITYFHTLFWPGMLKTAGFRLPTKVHIHGFLTVNGEKMSKSKGTFVTARGYLDHLNPSYLRYYYAAKLAPRVDDLDLNLGEFITKVNTDLVNKVVNLASRTARFAARTGLASTYGDDGGLFRDAAQQGDAIAAAYEGCDYNRAMRLVIALADRANAYIEGESPWNLAKAAGQAERLQHVCTVGLNLFRQLAVYLAPVQPRLAVQTGDLLGQPIAHWDESKTPLVGRPVARFQHMIQRVEAGQVEAMIAARQEQPVGRPPGDQARYRDSAEPLQHEPLAPECTIDDFAKVDLRVARVIAAADVPEARKLVRLTLSLGGDVQKTVFAGIKEAYPPSQLVGRLVVCVANLAPRRMRFGTSEGMVVAVGSGGQDIRLLDVDPGAVPGQRAH
ncbi:MAG: methionine--tRNA ligase [Planctomycetes bacterium RBG_16_64_10]|nr:MAG: methionine--tRNA ligase [Planctomycetes bacterium RBG_16_64_10]